MRRSLWLELLLAMSDAGNTTPTRLERLELKAALYCEPSEVRRRRGVQWQCRIPRNEVSDSIATKPIANRLLGALGCDRVEDPEEQPRAPSNGRAAPRNDGAGR